MKHYSIIYIVALIAGFIYVGCSDINEDINQPPALGIHAEGISNPNSTAFHGELIAANKYSLKQCQQCHGNNYSGASIGGSNISSCTSCHTGNNGPETCNTCHGDFADPTRSAPPRALNGSIETTYPGVGAHSKHLYENDLANNIRCSSCHTYPQSLNADGHLGDDIKAEIIFGRVSITQGVTPIYNFADNKCSNTYCHGNFTFRSVSTADSLRYIYTDSIMVGNNKIVVWNQVDGMQATCGSCHNLPPTGHFPHTIDNCWNCHSEVIDGDGNIIDQTKHINGIANIKYLQ
ncbi:MAG: hypothetical protein IPM56_09120 [Ignavibacteriales bacterium]|nr:MAG: hypothetical protein IPM56_09120 [Ignavibacteriales bacterium]